MRARPPVVVSGLPNMTPIFSRIWLMKIRQVLDLATMAGQLAQGLGHEPRLEADVRVAHLPFELGLGHQGRHRVDHDHVHGVAAHQHLGDLQRLLAVVGLGDEQVVDVDAQLSGVLGVQGVLGVDERGDAAPLLGLARHRQGQRGLAR